MRYYLPVFIIWVFLMAGCNWQETFRELESKLATTRQHIATLEKHREKAEEALVVAQAIDAQFGTAETHKAVTTARQALAAAEEAIPAAQASLLTLEKTAAEIQRRIENGDTWLGIVSGVAGTLIPGLGVAFEGFRRSRKRWIEAARQATQFGTAALAVDPNDEVAVRALKEQQKTQQMAAGVRDHIRTVLGT